MSKSQEYPKDLNFEVLPFRNDFFMQKCLRMCSECLGNKENTDKKKRETNLTDS